MFFIKVVFDHPDRHVFHHGKGTIIIEYQSGISCGIKLQGSYITGRSHLAGEFGHLKVTDQLIPCRCGAVGCLEAVAALPALTKKLQDIIQEIPGDRSQYPDKFDGTHILRSAAEGNRPAQRIVEEAFGYLGNAVGGLVNLLAPEAVAILVQSARKSILPAHIKQTDIRISQLQPTIAALGGAVALLDTLIDY